MSHRASPPRLSLPASRAQPMFPSGVWNCLSWKAPAGVASVASATSTAPGIAILLTTARLTRVAAQFHRSAVVPGAGEHSLLSPGPGRDPHLGAFSGGLHL